MRQGPVIRLAVQCGEQPRNMHVCDMARRRRLAIREFTMQQAGVPMTADHDLMVYERREASPDPSDRASERIGTIGTGTTVDN